MADNKPTSDILRGYSSEMLDLQRHIKRMLDDQMDEGEVLQRYPSIQRLISRTRDTVDRHIGEMERCLEAMGGEDTSWLKQAASSAASAVLGMATKPDGGERCSKMLRNNCGALGAGSIAAMMLYATAAAFDDLRIKEISGRQFDEMALLASETRDMIPEIVVAEFADEGYTVDRTSIEEVTQRAQQAWTRGAAAS